ncbi:hypothetical protein BDR26DRAFT_874482 [Obelidium mucronatum]|nr:hypothetical protein BDR26DRAFT_874482 [Obelidium mucronatum]
MSLSDSDSFQSAVEVLEVEEDEASSADAASFETAKTSRRPKSVSFTAEAPAFFRGRKTVAVAPGARGESEEDGVESQDESREQTAANIDSLLSNAIADSDDSLDGGAVARNTLANTRANSSPSRPVSRLQQRSHSQVRPPLAPAAPRLKSLDIFRGATILGMIVANYQIESVAWPILLHPPWIGLSLADLVFPSFLFIMGVAIPISMKSGKKSYQSILKRSLKLIAIGLLLNIPFSTIATFRFAGVLQRIGIVFWIVASAYKAIPSPNLFNFVFPSFLLGVWGLLTRVLVVPIANSSPFPDLPPCPAFHDPAFSYYEPPHCTAESYLDVSLFGRNHTYQNLPFDNEGTLSTLTSCITAIAGVVVGTSLQRAVQNDYSDGSWRMRLCFRLGMQSFGCLAVSGFFVICLGVPICKNLWTPSFVGVCLFFSIGVFGWMFWVVDGGSGTRRSVVVTDAEQSSLLGGTSSENVLAPHSSNAKVPLGFETLASCGRNPLALYIFSEVLVFALSAMEWCIPLFEFLFGWIQWGGLGSLLWSLLWALVVIAPFGVYLDSIKWYWRM